MEPWNVLNATELLSWQSKITKLAKNLEETKKNFESQILAIFAHYNEHFSGKRISTRVCLLLIFAYAENQLLAVFQQALYIWKDVTKYSQHGASNYFPILV